MEGDCLRGKAESALQTTALDERCEYPVGRVVNKRWNGGCGVKPLEPRLSDNLARVWQLKICTHTQTTNSAET